MKNGFESYKDILDVIIIPVSLALLAIIYPKLQSWYIRRRFKELIFRELVEISPYPTESKPGSKWDIHQTKRCIHKEIFKKASENRDFILSLEPDLVYYLSNLWQENQTPTQWLHYLLKLKNFPGAERVRDGKTLTEVYEKWEKLIEEYNKHPANNLNPDALETPTTKVLFQGQVVGDRPHVPEESVQTNENEGVKVEGTNL